MKWSPKEFKVFSLQSLGFLVVIALCWLRDLTNFPLILLENLPFLSGRLWGTVLETILLLGVWFLVSLSTARALQKLGRQEDFLRVCSWCRRIDYKGEWMPFEKFMNQGFDTPTTHGICPHCLERQRASLRRHRLERKKNTAQDTLDP